MKYGLIFGHDSCFKIALIEFVFLKYFKANKPVLLTSLMEDWRAYHDWVSTDGRPDLSLFSLNFAKSRVQVADSRARRDWG